MIRDVKTYFNKVTSRFSNAFDMQDFDAEEEAAFWALAAEHFSSSEVPSFENIATWLDRPFKAPVHLAYIKEGETLRLFKEHVIRGNLAFLPTISGVKEKSYKDKQQLIREFEERRTNISQIMRYRSEFEVPGIASFTIGSCQYIPLFWDDAFWGLYCVGPSVQIPDAIVPRISVIGRLLAEWLHEHYEKQTKLQYQITSRLKKKIHDAEENGLNYGAVTHFLLNYLTRPAIAQAALLIEGKETFSILHGVHIPEPLITFIEEASRDDDFNLQHYFKTHQQHFKEHGFKAMKAYAIETGTADATLYLLFSERVESHVMDEGIYLQIQQTLARVIRFNDETRKFSDEVLKTYYTMLRAIEKKLKKTYWHTPRLCAYVARFADAFGMNDKERDLVVKTARYHDIGYAGTEVYSLAADVEHPHIGKMMLRDLHIEKEVVMGVATHHEWMDGSGTPAGLKAEEIPWTGKVISIFEYIVQFIETNLNDTSLEEGQEHQQLTEALIERAGKKFDKRFMPAVIELIEGMSWQECCRLGVDDEG